MLITLSDRLLSFGEEKSTLAFIHDYLAARLVMLRGIEVRLDAWSSRGSKRKEG